MKKNYVLVLAGLSFSVLASGCFAEEYLFDLATKAPYKKAYAEMLAYPTWISEAQGVSTPTEKIVVQGKSYTLGHMCKPHDCADNQLSVVFTADGKKSWGLLAIRAPDGKTFNKYYLGNPDSVIEKLLSKSFSDNNPQD
jgi:hypothetical protein